MHTLRACKSPKDRGLESAGFTLVEVILAFTILSVALGIFVSMFLAAVRLAAECRDRTIAIELAETYLNVLGSAPNAYTWQTSKKNADGLFEITGGEGASGTSSIPPLPDTALASRSAQERITSLYHKFRCRTWGRLPSADAQAYEVTVSVSWYTQGRPICLTLTSSVPRMMIDRNPPQPAPGSEVAL